MRTTPDQTTYTVRRPGCTAWTNTRSEAAARREARAAKQVTGLPHRIYAEHPDGTVRDITTEAA